MTKISELHRKWSQSAEYRAAYEALTPEFELADALIRARTHAGLTQSELAKRMDTTQSVIARLESGRGHSSTKTLHKVALATGTRLQLNFVPAPEIPTPSQSVSKALSKHRES